MRDVAIEVKENIELGPKRNMALEVLEEMRSHGMFIALDDFGSGHSSMTNLTKLPLTALKLDKPFVRDIFNGGREYAVASTVIELARKLNVVSVAEGIETVEQMDVLRSMNCDLGQGHLFSLPLPAREIAAAIAWQNQNGFAHLKAPMARSA